MTYEATVYGWWVSGVPKQAQIPVAMPGRWGGYLRFIDPQREAGSAGSKGLDKIQILPLLTGAPLAYPGKLWNTHAGPQETKVGYNAR